MESTFSSVQDVCSALNEQAHFQNAGAALLREQKRIALMQMKVHPNTGGLIPSGPRKRGEGCDDENQGIVAAEETATGGARLRVTLLAAGFVIGPGGASIRAISHKSGADIRSWNDSITTNGRVRRVRTIVIEGNHRSVVLALSILCEAIELYKELCEGKYCGKFVDRCQVIRGVEFVYSPPPRSAVPYAAALKPESSGTGSLITAITQHTGGAHSTNPASIVATLDSTAEIYKSANTAGSLTADSSVPELSTATSAAAAAAAALASGPSALSMLSQTGNLNSMAPETPLVPHKMYDTSNQINAAGAEDTIMANHNFIISTAATAANPAAVNPAELPLPDFFRPLNPHEANVSLPDSSLQSEPQIPCYSLFGPDGNVFGPSLLRDIWGADGNGPGLPPIPSWRGNAPVSVSDDQLNAIGLPSYEDFAGKSPYYSANTNSLNSVLRSDEMPSLRLNNNGFLFSAYEDNNASSATPAPFSSTNPSESEYFAASNNIYMYHNDSNSAQDQTMHEAQQRN